MNNLHDVHICNVRWNLQSE